MQLTPLLKLAAALAVGAFVCVAQGAEGVVSDRIPVEIWRRGDIGSTVKLADALEAEIYGAARFARSTGKQTGTLIISIIQVVEQVEAGNRAQSWYRVDFATTDGKKLGTSSGGCWSDELPQCAKRVRADAELAALRLARGG